MRFVSSAGRVTNRRRYDRTENAISVDSDLQCSHQMARVYNDDVVTPFPPNLVGDWTSIRYVFYVARTHARARAHAHTLIRVKSIRSYMNFV